MFYHTWKKEKSTHYYEIDFLITQSSKVSAIEVKSSGVGKHESLTEFHKKYSKTVRDCVIISQKDTDREGQISFLPVYLTPLLCKF